MLKILLVDAGDALLFAAFMACAWAATRAVLALADRMPGGAALFRPPSHYVANLEGVRGILALAVAAHHACCWWYFLTTGRWETGPHTLFHNLAFFGVVQFFFLSGYLFWEKLERSERFDAGRFYAGRLLRLWPAYLCVMAVAGVVAFAAAGARFNEPASRLAREALDWLLFTLPGRPDVDGLAETFRIVCGVTWTLRLEWAFYLSMPALFLIARRRRGPLGVFPAAAAFGAICWAASRWATGLAWSWILDLGLDYAKSIFYGFGWGLLAARFSRGWGRAEPEDGSGWDWFLACGSAAYLFVPGLQKNLCHALLLAPLFAVLVRGADLWGLLRSRVAVLLGMISYDIYLCHGIVYYLLFRVATGGPRAPAGYLAQAALCVPAIVILALAIHLVGERPFTARHRPAAAAIPPSAGAPGLPAVSS